MILIEGNAAAALGAMLAGVTVVAWYPITPVFVAARDADRLHAEVPDGQGRPARRRSRSFRPRTRSRRSAWSWAPAGRARAR